MVFQLFSMDFLSIFSRFLRPICERPGERAWGSASKAHRGLPGGLLRDMSLFFASGGPPEATDCLRLLCGTSLKLFKAL